MITDAILQMGISVMRLLIGWLPTSTFDVEPWLSVAAGAGNLFGIIVDVPTLIWCVGAALTIEGGLLLLKTGTWVWSWIRG
jgi:hypothetical protein